MAESELAGKITKLVKAGDKLVRDVKKGSASVIIAVDDLKGENPGDKEKKEGEGPDADAKV